MKLVIPIFFCLLLFLGSCKPKADATVAAGETASKDTVTTEAHPPMDSAAMMKAFMDYATPGEMHAWMAKSAGTWDVEVRSYMNPEKPEQSKATSVVKMGMNNLYQMSDYTGTMMGAPFEGHGVMGYDNAKKIFVSSWIDNMGSGILFMTGKYDDAAKTLTLSGTQSDPLTGGDAPVRQVVHFTDDNTQSFEMFGMGPDGKEMKWMDATMKRKM